MTEDRSPWARPEAGTSGPEVTATGTEPRTTGNDSGAGFSAYPRKETTAVAERPAGYRSGTVTRLEAAPPRLDVVSGGRELPDEIIRRNRLMLRWFGGGAAVVVIVGVVVLLALALTGNAGSGGPFGRRAAGPPNTLPRLAQLCPPPSNDPGNG